MSEISDLAKVVYDDFFRRDVLGKLGPGLLAALPLALVAGFDKDRMTVLPSFPEWLFWVAAIPLVYSLGVALQITGELIGLLSPSPRPRQILFFRPRGNWAAVNDDFDDRVALISNASSQQLSDGAQKQRERYVVLKEASGNWSLALMVVAVYLAIYVSPTPKGAIAVCLLAALALWASHIVHARRQAIFEINTLRNSGIISQQRAQEMRGRFNHW
jgi:hypothetical protein